MTQDEIYKREMYWLDRHCIVYANHITDGNYELASAVGAVYNDEHSSKHINYFKELGDINEVYK